MKQVNALLISGLRAPFDAPKFTLDPEVTDFYAFTKNSVKLEGYQAHPLDQKIPVAV